MSLLGLPGTFSLRIAQYTSGEMVPSTLDLQAEADAQLLREIVADIVRQELQGPLGERITRSVRMLVRREINRALASRDFE